MPAASQGIMVPTGVEKPKRGRPSNNSIRQAAAAAAAAAAAGPERHGYSDGGDATPSRGPPPLAPEYLSQVGLVDLRDANFSSKRTESSCSQHVVELMLVDDMSVGNMLQPVTALSFDKAALHI